MAIPSGQARRGTRAPQRADAGEPGWVDDLRLRGPAHDEAVRRLRWTVRQAARHQVRRMPQVWSDLGAVRAEEIVESAADEATVAVLAALDRFEGRSRFTTWVYKFGIFHAASEARRALWRDRPVDLEDQPEPASADPITPETYAEARDLSAAVALALRTVLTPHQRRIARALIVDDVPIDVLAERLGTNRNALYKTLHDARVKLRAELRQRGFLPAPRANGVRR
ncbi:MAG: sigma-70 family RNA polymerase sigma factor [Pseudonocardia sp.]|nr:sigma-70 family RNA polymerase sigma factor [Pseudonocardia sp.]